MGKHSKGDEGAAPAAKAVNDETAPPLNPGAEMSGAEGLIPVLGVAPAPAEREDHKPWSPPPPAPSLGRIVIYTSAGEKGATGEQHAALITGVDAETVTLRAWSKTTDYVVQNVRFTDNAPGSVEAQGRWAWPPRV